jgi:membrane carboxypeptidase/penicillin-binding protein PbpC
MEGIYLNVEFLGIEPKVKKKVFSEENTYIVGNILSDPSARIITFGNPEYFNYDYPLLFKTGTSTNYRD